MRNAIVASALAVLALLLIQRSHAAGRRAVARSALACFALGLAASEYAVAYAGYVLLLEASQPTERARRLGAWVGLLAGYFALRGVLGFGSFGSGMYVDPLAEPLQFARQATARLPVLAGDLFGVIRADFWTSGFPRGPELAARGVLPVAWTTDMRPLQALQQQLGVVVLILGLAASAWAARRAPSPGARALALGAPLALVPVLSSLPESRLLAPAMFGWSAALAVLAHEAWTRIRERRSPLRVLALALCTLLVLHHLLLPSWISVTDARNGKHAAQAVRDSITAPELDARLGPAEHTLLLGAADPTTTIYVPLLRRVEGRPGPKNCHLLAAGFSQHRLQRRAPNTFVLERLQQGHTPGDNYARAFNSNALQVGARVQLHGMRVTLERVRNGRPQRTRYDFDRSLDDPSVVLLQQTVLGLRVVPFPPIGQSVVLPPPVPPFALIRRP